MIKLVVFDFDGCFTDNKVYVSEDGKESVRCCRSDGVGIKMLQNAGIDLFVVSQEKNAVVRERCLKLGVLCHYGVNDKTNFMSYEDLGSIAYFGNDLNDLECLRAVALPGCPSDAHPQVLGYCLTNGIVTAAKGGDGAVREFCEYILEAHG